MLTFIGCDLNLPEKWEAPQWDIPLNIPLIDQIIVFDGLLQGDVLTVDTTTSQIQIEFPGELDQQGIPNSIFNIPLDIDLEGKYSSTPIDLSVFAIDFQFSSPPINLSEPLSDLVEGIESIGIDFTCFSPILLTDPSVSDFLNPEIPPGTIDLSSLINLGQYVDSTFKLKSFQFLDGYFKLELNNDLPFQISSLSLTLANGAETIWEVNATDIDPYTLYNSQKLFSESPIKINMTEDLSYAFNISISPEQAGYIVDGNWNKSCFPDLDSPPIYLCNDFLEPIDINNPDDFPIPNESDFYFGDNTCNNECIGTNCLPIDYCGSDLYLGINDLSCDGFANLANPAIYSYLSFIYDGSNITKSGLLYPMDPSCASQIFINDGICNMSVLPDQPICTSGLIGMNCGIDLNNDGNINTECNTESECVLVLGEEISCSEVCSAGQYLDGWAYQPINEETGDNGKISISMEIVADQIDTIVVEIMPEINNAIDDNITSPEPIILSSFSGFNIKGVKVGSKSDEYRNEFTLDIDTDFIIPIDFTINMENFFDSNGSILSQTIKSTGNSETIISLEEYLIANDPNESEVFSEFNLSYDFNVEPGEYTVVPVDNKLNLGGITYSANISNLQLAYISAIADSLDFAPSESTPIEGMPTGFDGFELVDIQLTLDLYNQIGIPVVLDFEISGSKANILSDTAKVIVEINIPESSNECSYMAGDTARTIISINGNRQIVNKYCGIDTTLLIYSDTLHYSDQDLISFIDLMNFGPEIMEMDASVWINGKGRLAPGTNIWGSFELIAPLGFIFTKDINFIPEANITTLEPFDRSTADQIDAALVTALLNVEIENSSPIGGSMALFISDSTYFPLYLDSLVVGNSQYDSLLSVFNDSLEIDIAYTQYKTSESNGNKVLRIDFYDADSTQQFWIGRLFDLVFEGPDSVDFSTGFVNPLYPQINLNSMQIDTVRMGWLTEDDTHYMVPMITFNSTNGTPRTFQISNFLHLKSFITMSLNSQGILGGGTAEEDE